MNLNRVRPWALAFSYFLVLLFLSTCTSTGIAQVRGTFAPTGTPIVSRLYGHAATLLLNGKVLITGGTEARLGLPILSSAELFDPDTGAFTATGNMTTARSDHSATLLPDGRVLIIGGTSAPGDGPSTAELYDPSTGTFILTANTVSHQGLNTATLLNNGKVLIADGFSRDTDCCPYPDALGIPELYDPITGSFAMTGDYADRNVGTLYGTFGLLYQFATATLLPNGNVLIAGEPIAELYDPVTGMFSLTDRMVNNTFLGPSQPAYISGRTATLLKDGKVLLVGGENEDLGYFGAEAYDPSTEKFTFIGLMTTGRGLGHTATLLRDGTVLVAGGQRPESVSSTELYDPDTGVFSAAANMTSPRFFHTATLLMDGRVLFVGGSGCCQLGSNAAATAELYVPPVLVPAPVVTDLEFNQTSVVSGSSYSAIAVGSNLSPLIFFDVRYTSPGSDVSGVALNWQRGVVANHDVPFGIATGAWTINGVRAHEIETDHTGMFFPVSATITVSR
jgi:Galactose oxidase, central domain